MCPGSVDPILIPASSSLAPQCSTRSSRSSPSRIPQSAHTALVIDSSQCLHRCSSSGVLCPSRRHSCLQAAPLRNSSWQGKTHPLEGNKCCPYSNKTESTLSQFALETKSSRIAGGSARALLAPAPPRPLPYAQALKLFSIARSLPSEAAHALSLACTTKR